LRKRFIGFRRSGEQKDAGIRRCRSVVILSEARDLKVIDGKIAKLSNGVDAEILRRTSSVRLRMTSAAE
jgi:hypothetical protein